MDEPEAMDDAPDTNAEMWKSPDFVQRWAAEATRSEQKRAAERELLASLLPFAPSAAFTFLDLGAGTGAASRAILQMYPASVAILADFSTQMMSEGAASLEPFAGRYSAVEFDLHSASWPAAIPVTVDAIVTSMCIHHLPDERKQTLFGEVLSHLAPGGWYLNYDPVSPSDPVVEAMWQRVNEKRDPSLAHKREHRTEHEQAKWANHVRYIAPLDPQLEWLRAAGFVGVDVHWKTLENVIFGGCRPHV